MVAPGIEPADIDWESVASAFKPIHATTLPPATKIDIQNLLRHNNVNNNAIKALKA